MRKRSKPLPDDLKKKKSYWKLKEETLGQRKLTLEETMDVS